MDLVSAELELQRRWFQWAKTVARREVAEGFPFLHECQHNRGIRCFLAWIQEFDQSKQLAICNSLVKKLYDQLLHGESGECTPEDELAFAARLAGESKYHNILPPTPDCNKAAPGFGKADPKQCLDTIIAVMEPTFVRPRKPQRNMLQYRQSIGEWVLTSFIYVRVSDESCACYHFLDRSDKPKTPYENWSARIDPLIKLGVGSCNFPFVGKSHEKLCAEAVKASAIMVVSAAPTLVAGLGIED